MRSPKRMKEVPVRKQPGLNRDLDSSGILFQDAIKEKGKHWSKLHLEEAYRLNSLVGATEGFLDWNVVTNQVLFSIKLKKMLGYEESEIGNSLEEWTRRIHPDDLDMVFQAIDRHINGINKFYKKEHRIRCKIGNYKWIQNKGKVVERDKNGKALRFIVTVKDISHRKKSEIAYQERLKELNCHNQISKILGNSVRSASETIENIIHCIPPGFQYPDIAEVSLVLYDKTFHTNYFKKSNYCLTENIVINEKIIGRIEVCYPEDKLKQHEPVFLKEESDLLFSIAERVGKFVEKREKDLALKQSEEIYRNLVETIHEIIYEVTADGVIKYLSPSVEKILGYKPSELIGKQIIGIVHADDRPAWTNTLSTAGNHHSSFHEYRFITKSGDIRWLSKSTATIHKEGLLISKVGTLTDINDQKQAEFELRKIAKTFRNLVETISEAFFEIDNNGIIQYVSPVIKKMMEFSPDELTGKSLYLFVHPDDVNSVKEALSDKSRTDIVQVVFRYIAKSGKIGWIKSSASCLVENGVIVGRAGSMAEITDLMETEKKIGRALIDTKYANQPHSELFTRLSNELRTPLASILGSARLLEMENLTSSQRNEINLILQEGKNLEELVNEMNIFGNTNSL